VLSVVEAFAMLRTECPDFEARPLVLDRLQAEPAHVEVEVPLEIDPQDGEFAQGVLGLLVVGDQLAQMLLAQPVGLLGETQNLTIGLQLAVELVQGPVLLVLDDIRHRKRRRRSLLRAALAQRRSLRRLLGAAGLGGTLVTNVQILIVDTLAGHLFLSCVPIGS